MVGLWKLKQQNSGQWDVKEVSWEPLENVLLVFKKESETEDVGEAVMPGAGAAKLWPGGDKPEEKSQCRGDGWRGR